MSLLSVQPTPSVSFGHSNILQNGYTFILCLGTSDYIVYYSLYARCCVLHVCIHNEIELYMYVIFPLQAASLYWMGVAAEQSGDMHAGECHVHNYIQMYINFF